MTTLTSTSNTLTVNKESSGVDWVEVIEKMNSTPGTPRQEAKQELITAESTSAAPTTMALTKKEGGVQMPTSTKATMRIVPQSPVEEQNTVAEIDIRPMTPLDISGELKGEEKNAESTSSTTEIVVVEELREEGIEKEESGEGVDIPNSMVNIPEDQNINDIKTSAIDTSSDITKEETNPVSALPSPTDATKSTSDIVVETLPIGSTDSTSNTVQENEDMHPLVLQVEEEKSSSPQEEKKTVEVMEDSSSNLPVDISDKTMQDEAISTNSAPTSSATILDEKKEDATYEEPSTTSQATAEEQSKMDSVSEVKPDVVNITATPVKVEETTSQPIAVEQSKVGNEKEAKPNAASTTEKPVEVEETTVAPVPVLANEKSTSGNSPTEKHAGDQKDTSNTPDALVPVSVDDSQPPNQPKALSEESTNLKPPTSVVSNSKQEFGTEDKKGLHLFTKLKRKLSTNHMKDFKEDMTPTTALSFLPSPTTAASSPNSSIDEPMHIELVNSISKSPTTASPREGKKSDGLFRTLRAALSFSGRRSSKSPTVIKTGSTPVPSPTAARARTWDRKSPLKPSSTTAIKSPIRPSTAQAVLKSSEKVHTITKPIAKSPLSPKTSKQAQISIPKPRPSVRRPGHNSPAIRATLRQNQTWSPPGSKPVLASNPNAKLYTIWPRYPVVRAQMDEVQAMLEGFLPNDSDAIDKEFASGRDVNGEEVVNFWKAPLTVEQAEVVKAIQFVSLICCV